MYVIIHTLNIQVDDGGVKVLDSFPANIVPGLTVVQATVRGLDVWHVETGSSSEQVSVFKQPVATALDWRARVAAAAKGHQAAFNGGF